VSIRVREHPHSAGGLESFTVRCLRSRTRYEACTRTTTRAQRSLSCSSNVCVCSLWVLIVNRKGQAISWRVANTKSEERPGFPTAFGEKKWLAICTFARYMRSLCVCVCVRARARAQHIPSFCICLRQMCCARAHTHTHTHTHTQLQYLSQADVLRKKRQQQQKGQNTAAKNQDPDQHQNPSKRLPHWNRYSRQHPCTGRGRHKSVQQLQRQRPR